MLNLSKSTVEVIHVFDLLSSMPWKDVWGSGGIAVQFLNYASRLIELCGLLHAAPTLPLGKAPLTPFEYGPQRWSGCYGKEKNSFC